MRRFLYHIVRILPVLALVALGVWLSYPKWMEGRHVYAVFHGLAALGVATTLGCWLYGGQFEMRSFGAYISRYKSWRFFKRDILPYILFSLLGAAVAAVIFAVKGKENVLKDPVFYIVMGGFILALGLFEMIKGYIKYCYKGNGYQGK